MEEWQRLLDEALEHGLSVIDNLTDEDLDEIGN